MKGRSTTEMMHSHCRSQPLELHQFWILRLRKNHCITASFSIAHCYNLFDDSTTICTAKTSKLTNRFIIVFYVNIFVNTVQSNTASTLRLRNLGSDILSASQIHFNNSLLFSPCNPSKLSDSDKLQFLPSFDLVPFWCPIPWTQRWQRRTFGLVLIGCSDFSLLLSFRFLPYPNTDFLNTSSLILPRTFCNVQAFPLVTFGNMATTIPPLKFEISSRLRILLIKCFHVYPSSYGWRYQKTILLDIYHILRMLFNLFQLILSLFDLLEPTFAFWCGLLWYRISA